MQCSAQGLAEWDPFIKVDMLTKKGYAYFLAGYYLHKEDPSSLVVAKLEGACMALPDCEGCMTDEWAAGEFYKDAGLFAVQWPGGGLVNHSAMKS